MEISKISERIKERRKELNMTQKDLAEAMHVSNQLISKWETGESVPTLEYLQQLGEALHTSVPELMGIHEAPQKSEQPAPAEPAPVPASAAPKEKAPSKAKTFWRKNRKSLIISIGSAVAALWILAVALLSVFVFVPIANKGNYLDNINGGIDNYLELGYFNVKRSAEVDGDGDDDPDILQGYIDENGDAVYYNSETGETVKNKIMTYKTYLRDYCQKDYVQPDSIETVFDLFEEQLKTWSEDDDDFDLDDVTYIRKSGSGYYLEFSEEYLFKDFKPSEKKNIKLTEKIKGRVEMDGDIIKSMKVSVKFRNTVSKEKFSVVSKIEFIQTKPEIEHEKYIATGGAERITKEQFLEKINAVSVKDSLCSEFKEALKNNRLYFDNDSLYTHTYHEFIIFDENNYTVKQEIDNLDLWENYATPYGGAIWYVKTDYGSTAYQYQLCRYDLQTGSKAGKLNFDRDFSFAGNKHYFYANCKSGDGDVKSFVYDMSLQKKIMESKTDTVKCVDDAGNIYCYDSNEDLIYIYGTDKELKGNEIVKKVDDVVYIRDKADRTVLYQYKGGDPVRAIHLSSESASFNDDYSWDYYENEISYLNGETALSLPKYMTLSNADDKDTEYEVKILTVWDNWALCCFSKSYSSVDLYIGLFRLGEQNSLIAYTGELPCKSAWVYRFGGKTYLALYEGSTSYNGVQDFLLLQS